MLVDAVLHQPDSKHLEVVPPRRISLMVDLGRDRGDGWQHGSTMWLTSPCGPICH
jgi:hypothetical protein